MKEVYKDIYLVEIPLRGNPLKSLNCFIIKSEDQNLIIDTGFNTEEIENAMMDTIRKLNLDIEKTSLFLTHLHADHTGLASFLDKKGMKIYMSEVDGEILKDSIAEDGSFWSKVNEIGMMQGLAEDKVTLESNPGFKYQAPEVFNYTPVKAGEFLKVGRYNFEVIDLEGHTPGIVGLYEKDHKIFFCGDHILGKITPNITFWGFEYGDILGKYLDSLDKVYKMEIDHLFSSHRFLVDDHRVRIDEIKKHHDKRLEESINVLKKHGKSSVRTVTKNLSWDIRSKSWDDFPNPQKWFAAGEAHAHLERLRALNKVDYEIKDGIIYYFLLDK
ncbi:MAG: MBL fold metallo-hydrolase [Tissierellia bacterium]|nr:MBL fold metallo-hydrolase [Tissierellia bacterium]